MKRLLGSRGATGAEYALVLTLVVVSSIGAINFLSDRASNETRNQADCVQTRPPTDNCQLPPLVPTTTTTIAPGPGPTPPGPGPGPTPPGNPCDVDDAPASCYEPPPPPSTMPPPPSNQSDWPGQPGSAINGATGDWEVSPGIVVVDATGVPVEGARVVFAIVVHNPNPPPQYLPTIFAECVTDASGTCTATVAIPYSNATTVDVSVYQIISTPATDPPPTEWTGITKP